MKERTRLFRLYPHLELLVRGVRGGTFHTEMEVRLFVAFVTDVGRPERGEGHKEIMK